MLFRSQMSNAERGDSTQLGGVFIVQPGGEVVWAHRSAYAGDRPTNEAVLAALHRATGARA